MSIKTIQKVDLLVYLGEPVGVRVHYVVNNNTLYGDIDLDVLKAYIEPKHLTGLKEVIMKEENGVYYTDLERSHSLVITDMSTNTSFIHLVLKYLLKRYVNSMLSSTSNQSYVQQDSTENSKRVSIQRVRLLYEGLSKFNIAHQSIDDIGLPLQYRQASGVYFIDGLYPHSLLSKLDKGYISNAGYQVYNVYQNIGKLLINNNPKELAKVKCLNQLSLSSQMRNVLLRYTHYLSNIKLVQAEKMDDCVLDSEGLSKYSYIKKDIETQLKLISLIVYSLRDGRDNIVLKPLNCMQDTVILLQDMIQDLQEKLALYLKQPKELDKTSNKQVNNKEVILVVAKLRGYDASDITETEIVDTLESYILDLKSKLRLLRSGNTKVEVYLTGYTGYIEAVSEGNVLEEKYKKLLKELK